MFREIVVEEAGQRLDQFVAGSCPDLSRAAVQRLLEAGLISLNGALAKASQRVEAGDRVSIEIPPPSPSKLEPEAIPLDIVYEDADVLVINKPAGLVVHPAPGHQTGTLVHAVLALDLELDVGNSERPGIVHRLDKDTSGLMVVAKNDRAHAALSDQMHRHTMKKEYVALAHGRVTPERGIVEAPIGRDPRARKRMAVTSGGRPARTHFEVLEYLTGYSLVLARLETGRTHQIRVHLSAIGHPLAGDSVYGTDKDLPGLGRQFLHSHRLGFELPSGGYREFTAPLPDDLRSTLKSLGSANSDRL
jgi:23S rRNA pseudouridine1911/1915/1917 synthase